MRRLLDSGHRRVLDERLELSALRRDGTEFPAELTITVVRSGARLAFAGFLRDLRSQDRLRRLPIVICTGAPPPRRRFLGRLAPVLAKPFDVRAFERIVRDVAGAG